MLYGDEQKIEIGSKNGNGRNAGFLRPLISAYSLPLHGITGIPGKISGALMAVNSIDDAVPLIHGPVGCAFQRKINPFRPYLPFYEILAFDRFKKTRDPELFSPYGIEGSARVLMEIAQRLGKEGEAEEVIARRKKDATERLSKAKVGLEGKKVVGGSGLHGIGMSLLRDMGLKTSVIIHKTQMFEHRLTSEAINELLNMSVELARKYGSDPEVLVNPTIEEEIKAIKETGTDLVISAGATAQRYNKEGIRTFNPMDFMLHHQRIGFEAPIEMARMLKEALKKPQRRDPLLSMLKYDPYRTNLIPEWATLADMFGTVRQGAVGDKVVAGMYMGVG